MNDSLIERYKLAIASFMGLVVDDTPTLPEEMPTRYTLDQLQFESEWDYIMPVVEKIESLNNHGFDFHILAHGTVIRCHRPKPGMETTFGENVVDATAANYSFNKKIDHVFRACGMFLTENRISGKEVRLGKA